MLTEVAMGNINEKMTFDHNAHNLPKGKDSVRGKHNVYFFIFAVKDVLKMLRIQKNIKF